MHIRRLLGLAIVLLIIVIPIFSHLDDFAIQIWDEGRLANNAIEMYKTGNIIVTTYDYLPDMWNTKPPLMIWLQVLSLKALGLNELAIRLPSALAALGTCIFLYWLCARKFKAPLIGILSCLVLVTCPGYISFHGTRTGDYDSLLTLCTIMYVFYFYLFIEESNKKYLLLSFLFIILASLTKGIAGLFFLPALFIFTIYRKKLIVTLKTPQLYAGIGVFVLFVVGYYLLRDHYNPGYIQAVMENELGGRYSTVIENHQGGPLYYYHLIIDKGFRTWYIFYAISVAVGYFSNNKLIRDITIFTFICTLSLVIILAMGSTKLDWYILPLYPLMAITVATLLYSIFDVLSNTASWKPYLSYNLLPYIFLFIVFLQPYSDTVKFVTMSHGDEDNAADLAEVLRMTLKGKYPYDHPMKLFYYDYNSQLDWYLKVAELKEAPISRVHIFEFNKEDLVAVYSDEIRKDIEKNYLYHIVITHDGASIYQVHGLKPAS